MHPKRIIVGLDVDRLLGRKKVEDRRIAISNGAVIPRLTQFSIDILSTLSIDFARDMMMSIAFHGGLLPSKGGNVFGSSGAIQYRQRLISEEQFRAAVSGCAAQIHSQIARYDMVSDIQFGALKRFLARASGDGAQVEIFTTPYHPTALSEITNGTAYYGLRNQAMLRLSRELRPFYSALVDLSDSKFPVAGAEGWGDCVHYTGPNGDFIIEELLSAKQN